MTKTPSSFKKHNLDPAYLLKGSITTARAAGKVIRKIYNAAATDKSSMGVEIKADNSPITKADKASTKLIESRLARLTPGIAIMSEENKTTPDSSEPYWAVDPLDGTKLFIERTGGFAVNIALMLDGAPVLGVVYCPAFDTIYYSYEGSASFKQTENNPAIQIKTRPSLNKKGALRALFDQAHADPALYHLQRSELETQRGLFLPENPEIIRRLPSNMEVAEGSHDIHIKTGKDPALQHSAGYVWDNAADFIILKNAGGAMLQILDGKPLQFDTGRDRQKAYIAFGDKNLAAQIFPQR